MNANLSRLPLSFFLRKRRHKDFSKTTDSAKRSCFSSCSVKRCVPCDHAFPKNKKLQLSMSSASDFALINPIEAHLSSPVHVHVPLSLVITRV